MRKLLEEAILQLDTIICDKVDISHGLQHAITVMEHIKKAIVDMDLTKDEQIALLLAGLLHDADDHKYFPESKDLDNARTVLSALNISTTTRDLVLRMIHLVSCSSNGNSAAETELMLYPRFADRLESVGEIGILRCWLYTKHVQRPLYDESTLRAKTKDELVVIASAERFQRYVNGDKKGSPTFIDHFYDKLYGFNAQITTNPYFQKEMLARINVIETFLLEFGRSGTVDETYLNQLFKKYF